MIGVIDYRTGNSQSVSYALAHLGIEHRLVQFPHQADDVDRYVLPGVGSAGVTMASLTDDGWVEHLEKKVVGDGELFLGICVGLQVLFTHSEEDDQECFGWLPGEVRHFDRSQVRVPHMGWNVVEARGSHPLAQAFAGDEHFYFVNSYFAVPDDPSCLAGETLYQQPFAAAVAKGNIMGTQFHTEKSAAAGLKVLRRFANLTREEV